VTFGAERQPLRAERQSARMSKITNGNSGRRRVKLAKLLANRHVGLTGACLVCCIAICRSPVSDAWYLFDDHEVTQVSVDSVATKDAYMLFYQRRCERNSQAAAQLQSYVTPSSLVNSSVDSTLCGT